MLRCESLVLYRIMYGCRVMKVQRRNNFVVGSDTTEIISLGRGGCWGHGRIKLKQLAQGRNCFLKKNQTTPRPSEHPPVMGEKMSKRLGGIKRLQIQNHFMAFKQVPRCRYHWVHSIMSGRNPPLYCTFTLIAMQGHQKNIRSKPETM